MIFLILWKKACDENARKRFVFSTIMIEYEY